MAVSRSARALRSAKKASAVVIAESFSAAAMTRNWFMLVPSAAANFSTAAFKEFGSRKEKVETFVVMSVPFSVHPPSLADRSNHSELALR
jgi:hypothetical protein